MKKIYDEKGADVLRTTPFGNDILADLAIRAIDKEQLGKDAITDFLTVSFSSTDYVGHRFGANSKEIQDTYIRLDKEIERLLMYLDEEIGKREYTVFLTADHGATDAPGFLKENKIPINYINIKTRLFQAGFLFFAETRSTLSKNGKITNCSTKVRTFKRRFHETSQRYWNLH